MKVRSAAILIALLFAIPLALGQRGERRGPPPGPPPDLPPLLLRAISASKTARYSGERRVEFRIGSDRQVIREIVIRDGMRSRIEFPDDSAYHGQVIVEDGRERRHYFPDRNEIRVLEPRGDESMRRLTFLLSRGKSRGVRVALQPGSEVAGLGTELVAIIDRHGNPMHRLWIHPRSGIVMKREAYDRTGSRVGGFEFLRINLAPKIDASDFTIVRRGATIVTEADMVRRHAAELGLTPVIVPESRGFKLMGVRVMDRGPQPVLMQSYAGPDGRFTLFQLKAALDPSRLKRFGGRGELATHSWTRGDESFALVGDVSLDELRAIAQVLGAP